MRKWESASSNKILAEQAKAELDNLPAALPASQPSLPRATRRDQLAYLADMIDELGTMADRLGCSTLAGILDLAKGEAHLERSRT